MDRISRDPLWLSAQVPFVDLSEKVRANPVSVEPSKTEALKCSHT
jgi:hypothetical protein